MKKVNKCQNCILVIYSCLVWRMSLRKKCPYLELFWSAFFPHFPAFGLNTERYEVAPYSSEYGHFSCFIKNHFYLLIFTLLLISERNIFKLFVIS